MSYSNLIAKALRAISESPKLFLWRFFIRRDDANLERFTIGPTKQDAFKKAKAKAKAENAEIAVDASFENAGEIDMEKLRQMTDGFSNLENAPITLQEIFEVYAFEEMELRRRKKQMGELIGQATALSMNHVTDSQLNARQNAL